MPALLFFTYFLLETVTFWAVSTWIGVGWALIALFATMFFGMSVAMFEVRRMMSSKIVKAEDGALYMKDDRPGRTAGNVGLTIAGGVLLSLPGFLSTIVGLLLIFPPTRALFRAIVTVGIFRSIENMGVKMYEHSPMSQRRTSYGHFGSGDGAASHGASFGEASGPGSRGASTEGWNQDPDLVINEDELREWAEHLNPEDFGPRGGSDTDGDAGKDSGSQDNGTPGGKK